MHTDHLIIPGVKAVTEPYDRLLTYLLKGPLDYSIADF